MQTTQEKNVRVRLVAITPNAEELIAYMARVSSANQENPDYEKLIRFMLRNGHVSPFQMVNMTLEFITSRVVSQQFMRHWSIMNHELDAQEFSQRYAAVVDMEPVHPRIAGSSDRQGSLDIATPSQTDWWDREYQSLVDHSLRFYKEALEFGFAKESARFGLLGSAQTRFYLNGSVRSWIHYLQSRTDPHAQQEHQDLANAAKAIFIANFPTVSKALDWS